MEQREVSGFSGVRVMGIDTINLACFGVSLEGTTVVISGTFQVL